MKKWDPKLCKCGKVALYRVAFTGYCKEHYADAVKAQAKSLDEQKAWAIANK